LPFLDFVVKQPALREIQLLCPRDLDNDGGRIKQPEAVVAPERNVIGKGATKTVADRKDILVEVL